MKSWDEDSRTTHPDEGFARGGPPHMPHIQITWIEGRTTEQKRSLVTKLTDLMVAEASAKPESVTIAFVDVPAESYASNGMLVADKRKKL
jgi:4-oxalocrotonate tautomerase